MLYIYITFNCIVMKDLKDKLSKINLWTLVIAFVVMVCNFIPSSESFKVILLILTSMNTGVILFSLWLRNQLKKIK